MAFVCLTSYTLNDYVADGRKIILKFKRTSTPQTGNSESVTREDNEHSNGEEENAEDPPTKTKTIRVW